MARPVGAHRSDGRGHHRPALRQQRLHRARAPLLEVAKQVATAAADIPEMTIEPHPPHPVPVLCGGESAAALKRAARLCDGWVGTAYTLDEAERVIGRLNGYRRDYGRENEPFEIIATVRGEPTPDLYERAAELGITGVTASPWANRERTHAGDHRDLKKPAERYREPIERFAEEIVAKLP